MNRAVITRIIFAVAFVVLAAVNWMVLSRVAENRKSEPVAHMWLSERELSKVKWLALENSGVDLRINWRSLGGRDNRGTSRSPSWLRGKKLEELGFVFVDGKPTGDALLNQGVEREVYLVMEYNGPAYHEAIRRAERGLAELEEKQHDIAGERSTPTDRYQARKRIRQEMGELSRLFVIDAGLEPKELQESYNNPERYIITRGLIRLYYQSENKRYWARGRIQGLKPAKMHLSLRQRQQLDHILRGKKKKNAVVHLSRYEAEVIYGSHYEPFIQQIRKMKPIEQPQESKAANPGAS
ncbi:DUF4824 family protein [Desulfobulbus rhabdoformis]|uniref:DUF4824 family protein n=1 Tax=Desulfobulbus rhabdoformis TaxID=34032 RepID=UPI0019649840|nr:DUF4824 family protein [Desulfobulbus rhabdoformis]MBM9616676.1 DUF4824 family protein [Desulfobulbus rhabdoformis]